MTSIPSWLVMSGVVLKNFRWPTDATETAMAPAVTTSGELLRPLGVLMMSATSPLLDPSMSATEFPLAVKRARPPNSKR